MEFSVSVVEYPPAFNTFKRERDCHVSESQGTVDIGRRTTKSPNPMEFSVGVVKYPPAFNTFQAGMRLSLL